MYNYYYYFIQIIEIAYDHDEILIQSIGMFRIMLDFRNEHRILI